MININYIKSSQKSIESHFEFSFTPNFYFKYSSSVFVAMTLEDNKIIAKVVNFNYSEFASSLHSGESETTLYFQAMLSNDKKHFVLDKKYTSLKSDFEKYFTDNMIKRLVDI